VASPPGSEEGQGNELTELQIKKASSSGWDLVSLGEILLRFDPGNERIRNAREFSVWDGGAEYNVAKNLSKVFGARTAIATSLVDNQVGHLASNRAQEGGVDTSLVRWNDGTDGERNGIYFIERGFGLRVPTSCFDRSNTAVSRLRPGDIDWGSIFGGDRCRWFHTGGIFSGLSDSSFETAREAMSAAREHGVVVSYDLNYRDSLWKHRGGIDAANEQNRKLLGFADVVFGIPDHRPGFEDFNADAFGDAAENLQAEYPETKFVVSTLRNVRSASVHDLSAVCWSDGSVYKSDEYRDVNVLDRVGSGDAFAAGFIHGLLNELGIEFALNCGTAHACLAMCTPGDNSTATLQEIEGLMENGALHIDR